MSVELVAKMKARIDQCRRLAEQIDDPIAREALLVIAAEGEADMLSLQASIESDEID